MPQASSLVAHRTSLRYACLSSAIAKKKPEMSARTAYRGYFTAFSMTRRCYFLYAAMPLSRYLTYSSILKLAPCGGTSVSPFSLMIT
jgi:hypothetical protein